MFNFTTQTVINTLSTFDKNSNPKGRFEDGTSATPKYIRIDNMIFKYGEVYSAEKKLPSPEVLAEVTFNLSDLDSIFVEGGPTTATGRLAVYIGLNQSSTDSFYSNYSAYKGKPLYLEFSFSKGTGADAEAEAAATATNAATNIIKTLKSTKAWKMDGKDILTVTTDGEGSITIKATSGHQIIREAAVQVYDDSIYAIDCCSSEGGFKNIIEGTPVFGKLFTKSGASATELTIAAEPDLEDADGNDADEINGAIKQGQEAFGDYWWIMHNLRIPTSANTNYWSAAGPRFADELPVSNGKYIQYTIKMRAERDNIATGVVGQVTTTQTTHVFYILNTNTAAISALDTAIGKLTTLNTSTDGVVASS